MPGDLYLSIKTKSFAEYVFSINIYNLIKSIFIYNGIHSYSYVGVSYAHYNAVYQAA